MKNKEFRSAPKKLFKTPFPDKINNFKVNQKLEGIDPEHEALFCVMTVIEVSGNIYYFNIFMKNKFSFFNKFLFF